MINGRSESTGESGVMNWTSVADFGFIHSKAGEM
jgi:hypothetical protein